MIAHNEKLERANVIGVFGSQDEAEEAVLELRSVGFRDDRVGYFARNLEGLVTDYIGKGHTLAGVVLGGIAGIALGLCAGWYAMDEGSALFGPTFTTSWTGFLTVWAACGAILGGMIGALIGWGMPRGDTVHYGDEVPPGEYVIAVNAGERNDEAWGILRRHGGHPPAIPMPVM